MNPNIALLLGLLLIGCQRSNSYEQMRQRELAKGDSLQALFLNYELGMTRQAFYDSSWALNRRGMVKQGPRNQNVQYPLPDALPYPATMLFYPDFAGDRIARMRVLFLYDQWAPWTSRLASDSLALDVKALMETWYGGQYLVQDVPKGFNETSKQFVSIQSNREIRIGVLSDREVFVHVTDLRNPPEVLLP